MTNPVYKFTMPARDIITDASLDLVMMASIEHEHLVMHVSPRNSPLYKLSLRLSKEAMIAAIMRLRVAEGTDEGTT